MSAPALLVDRPEDGWPAEELDRPQSMIVQRLRRAGALLPDAEVAAIADDVIAEALRISVAWVEGECGRRERNAKHHAVVAEPTMQQETDQAPTVAYQTLAPLYFTHPELGAAGSGGASCATRVVRLSSCGVTSWLSGGEPRSPGR